MILSLVLLFTACSTTKPQITHTPKILPAWYLTPPTNNSQFLYGVGSGSNREQSIKSALDDLASKLGISIESNFNSTQTSNKGFREYISINTNFNIKSSIDEIRISNYEILDAKKVKYNNYITIIRSNKDSFTDSLISSLDNTFGTIKDKERSIINTDPLSRYSFYKSSSKTLSKIFYKLLVLDSLSEGFDIDKYLQFIKRINTKLNILQNNINFFVINYARTDLFENILKSYINNHFCIADKNTNNKEQLKTYISYNVQYSKFNGFIIADVLVTVTIKDYKNNTIKTDQTEVLGHSVSSKTNALKDASLQYYEKLNII
jgi:hypothetical protein